MVKIDVIYNDYLLKKQDEHKVKYEKHKGWFSASSAGSCFRKQYLKAQGKEEKPMDARTMRVLRLGTIVHTDLEQAIKQYVYDDNIDVYSEHRIELPELNVVGHLDMAFHFKDEDTVSVYDLKTAHSFKWKKLFGRNIDPNPSTNYQLQLGTYGVGMANELETQDVSLNLVWYKKDDSLMKTQPIDSIWLDRAYEYWVELNEVLEDTSPHGGPVVGDMNTPVYNWECNYCPFKGTDCTGA
jgi:hypothetical protein